MTYYIYDEFGFLSGTTDDPTTPRSTAIAPQGNENNFVGSGWVYVDKVTLEQQMQETSVKAKTTQRIQSLKQIRDELTESGGCLVQGKWFHTDVKSKQQQMALTMAGANLPLNLLWKTMDGSFILMTQPLAQELFAAQMTREATIFGLCEAKQHDDTPINEGWPERYIPVVEEALPV
jgi:hypothetical protein